MNYLYLLTLIILLQYFFLITKVGGAREKYNVLAPKVSGHEEFEKLYRVQMNTLEILIMFFPLCYITAQFFDPKIVALIGLLFPIGRFLFYKAYIVDPKTRSAGFITSMLPIFIYIIMTIVGLVRSF